MRKETTKAHKTQIVRSQGSDPMERIIDYLRSPNSAKQSGWFYDLARLVGQILLYEKVKEVGTGVFSQVKSSFWGFVSYVAGDDPGTEKQELLITAFTKELRKTADFMEYAQKSDLTAMEKTELIQCMFLGERVPSSTRVITLYNEYEEKFNSMGAPAAFKE